MRCPLPLGAIAIRRALGPDAARAVDEDIRASLRASRADPARVMPFVQTHAQEMAPDVVQQHIDLYVNDYTTDLGRNGEAAIKKMFEYAAQASIVSSIPANIFY